VPATSNRDFANLLVNDEHLADHINLTRLTFIQAENGATSSLSDYQSSGKPVSIGPSNTT